MEKGKSRETFRNMSDKDKLVFLAEYYEPEVFKKYPNLLEEAKGKVVSSEELSVSVEDKIKNLTNSENRVLLISTAGMSGVGKSDKINKFKETSKNLRVRYEAEGIDDFIGTPRGGKKRKEMPESRENYEKGFYNVKKLRSYFNKIITSMPESLIEENGIYDRYNNGKMTGKKELRIPKNKFVLIVEGVDAISHTDSVICGKDGVDKLNIVILDDPAESMLRRLFIDVEVKGIPLKDMMISRMKEYSNMQYDIMKNIKDADLIVFNNTANQVVSEWLKKFINKTGKSKEEILEIMKEAELKFYKQKFIKNENPEFMITDKEVKKFMRALRKRMNIVFEEIPISL